LFVHGDHRGARDARVLDGEVTETAGAEDGDEARGTGPGVLDRLVGRDARARQRGRVGGVDAFRDADDVAGIADGVLGEAAVEGVAHVLLLEAERLAAAVAVAADAARVAEPRERHAHTRFEAVHGAVAERFDDADAFVARDERR
jgi:hypothetical protein